MRVRQKTWSISIKLWAAMMILILVVLGGLGLVITWLFGDFYLNQKLAELGDEAKQISVQLENQPSWAERLVALQNIKLTSGTQLVVLNLEGGLIAAEGNGGSGNGLRNGMPWRSGLGFGAQGMGPGWLAHSVLLTDFFTPDNLQQVVAGKTLTINALSNNDGQAMLIAATPLGKPVEAVVLLGSSPAPVQESIGTFRKIILYSSLLAVLLATLVSLFFARQVTRPLAVMQKAASRMAKGDFQAIAGVKSRDEIGELAEALNAMGESLRNHVNWLSQERNLLAGMVEGMSDSVIMLDAEGRILYTNEPAKALWLEDEGEASDRKDQILSFLQQLLKEKDEEQTANLTLETQVLQVALASTPAREGVDGYVAVLRDITASLRAEKERRDFMASVTHELRTPLHLIQGYLEAIQDGVIPQEEQAEQIEFVLDEARRLAKLVKELQEVNQLERWQNLELHSFDLRLFLEELEYRYQGTAKEKQIHLVIDGVEGEIVADRDRLLQVFINLLDNAFRHTPKGKTIQINVSKVEGRVQFLVEDEGEGIPLQSLPHIFKRFYRVDKARSRREGGMGLGLAIVKQIIDAHGGSIKVESEVGQGSRFKISLPLFQ